MRRIPHLLLLLATCAALAFAATACKRKPEDLEVWRPSKASNGEEKLMEWIASPDEPLPVRVRAAEILLEEDLPYDVAKALEQATPADQRALIDALAPKLLADYNTRDATVEAYQSNASKQVRAKEGIFQLYRFAAGSPHQAALEDALVDWLTGDFFIRDQMGAIKMNQIAELLGPRAAAPLLAALEKPENNQKFIADILRKINDPKVQEQTAQTLLKLGTQQLPKLDKDLEVAVLEEPHKAITPLLVKLVDDANIDDQLRTAAHARIGQINGREALPIYIKWVKSGPDILRWVSIQSIGETQGKPGVMAILGALPETGDYGGGEPNGFSTDAGRFCMVEVKEMKTDLQDAFLGALKTGSTPAKALALRCLQEIGKPAARPAVEPLLTDKTPLPAWEGAADLGALAQQTLDKLPK